MPVLEEARTMDYVTNHNMITIAMTIFTTLKMAAERGGLQWKPIRFNLAFIWTFHAKMIMTQKICQVYTIFKVLVFEKGKDPRGRSFAKHVRNAAWLCNLKRETGKQFFKCSPFIRSLVKYVIKKNKERSCVCSNVYPVNIRFCFAWSNFNGQL